MTALPPPGWVVWITGLSGSGKSTLATEVAAALRGRGHAAVRLDGDRIREIAGNDLGYTPEDRLANALRISRLAAYLASEGAWVVVSTISLFRTVHDANREAIARYLEVYLRASTDALATRNPRGVHARAMAGELQNVVGADLDFDEPARPDLVFDHDAGVSLGEMSARILVALDA